MRRFIHFDANFRLVLSKKENRSTADRTLWSDGGFFADPQTYKEYLASVNQEHHEVRLYYHKYRLLILIFM